MRYNQQQQQQQQQQQNSKNNNARYLYSNQRVSSQKPTMLALRRLDTSTFGPKPRISIRSDKSTIFIAEFSARNRSFFILIFDVHPVDSVKYYFIILKQIQELLVHFSRVPPNHCQENWKNSCRALGTMELLWRHLEQHWELLTNTHWQ